MTYGHPNILNDTCGGILPDSDHKTSIFFFFFKKPLWSWGEDGEAARRSCCFPLPLLINAEVMCLSEEESRWEV